MRKAFILLALLLFTTASQAASRVALVVGNGSYLQGRLANPTNDAQDVSRALRQLGFQVDLVQDSNRSNLHRAIQKFRSKLNSQTEVALFFYAGHGAQFEGQSFLLPLRANIKTAADLEIEALSAKSILTQMRSTGSLVNVMILDACRNLPYPALNRSSSRGLARIETIGSALLAFATAPGQVAADGRTRNSPYTTQLLTHLKKPGLTISQLFNDVGFAVHRSTGGRQTPWMNSSPMPAIYLAGNKTTNTTVRQKPSVQSVITSSRTLHNHNGREHDHPLPASGKNHQHGGTTSTPATRVVAPTAPQRDSSAQVTLDPNTELKKAFADKNYPKAFRISSEHAKKGDAAGQYILGQLYLNGQGVNKNPGVAFSWLKKAANQRHPQAQNALGSLYATGVGTRKNMQLARQQFNLASQRGVADAMRSLGIMYDKGDGVPKNMGAAIGWYEKAANKGMIDVQMMLAERYLKGIGVKSNPGKAFAYATKASKAEIPDANYLLGLMYASGQGTRKNPQLAFKNMKIASDKGLPQAQYSIGAMYIQGLGTSKNPQMAFRMFQLAANKNIPLAMHSLGLMHLHGRATKKNPSLAFNWLNKAAQTGLKKSQFLLGDLYVDGVGVTKNYQLAMRWYRKAADQGLPMAQYSVGALFANGFGVRKDVNEARIWFNRAAKQGLPRAKKAIEQLNKR